ncbi:hypothetical protein [Nocardia barduliensis]|uniref:hypothetical protein n=1 Tax=Nocardia barduliensis TaxID=2736643 RepID=UPI001574D746|nr:hypothetical protein [Nocardia barduliensis]
MEMRERPARRFAHGNGTLERRNGSAAYRALRWITAAPGAGVEIAARTAPILRERRFATGG